MDEFDKTRDRRRVLWLDNDLAFIQPLRESLEENNIAVLAVGSVSEAEEALRTAPWDLAIVDAMIPIDESEEMSYPSADTDDSHRTGLIFYRRMKAQGLLPRRTSILTVRIDKKIREAFLSAGVEEDLFWTKMDLRHTADFVQKVTGVLARQ